MNKVLGTKGYEKVVEAFAEASFKLDFEYVNENFLKVLPQIPCRVLDVGAGVGQNSANLAQKGYSVVAVEPLFEFISIAKSKFSHLNITWIHDSLPKLEKIDDSGELFDFILMSAVWHHLNTLERRECIQRFANITNDGAVCAISLRNGPAGAGKHIFPTFSKELIDYAHEFGFTVVVHLENQSSKMANKSGVTWTQIALKKKLKRKSIL